MILELAVDVIEIAIFPAMAAVEVAVTRGIRASIAALRRIPIFIPGATGGVGAFLKTAPRAAAKAVAAGSSRALGRAMTLAGKIRLPGEFAHHIVAHGDRRAKEALEILDRFGIKVNDAVNGVFLPGYKTSPNPMGKAVHSTVHTDEYYRAVNKLIKSATTQQEAIQKLRFIANQLEKGILP